MEDENAKEFQVEIEDHYGNIVPMPDMDRQEYFYARIWKGDWESGEFEGELAIDVHVKLDDEGVVVDLFSVKDDHALRASTWALYTEFTGDDNGHEKED